MHVSAYVFIASSAMVLTGASAAVLQNRTTAVAEDQAWHLYFYPEGASCTGEYSGSKEAYLSQRNGDIPCEDTGVQTHDVLADGIAAANKVVRFYSDEFCMTLAGYLDADGCHIVPADVGCLNDVPSPSADFDTDADRHIHGVSQGYLSGATYSSTAGGRICRTSPRRGCAERESAGC